MSADMRDGWRTALAAVAVLALVSCAGSESAAPAPSHSRSGPSDPIALVGMWTLTGVGAEAGTVVGLTPAALTIYRSCGELRASWSADSQGLFIADVMGSSGGCDPETRVAWLNQATGYRLDGSSHAVLLDGDGETVARLAASSAPPRPDRESFEVTDEFRRSFDSPAALPPGLTPADRRELAGRWEPVRGGSAALQQPYLEFRADGRWSGSDGCNGSGGGWVVGPAGTLLATSGISTLVGCDNIPVGDWLSAARRAGFDGAMLVLLDQDAEELGRLHRASRFGRIG
ncbi:META domain-containing protein [Actinoplanes sp. ATCC 53533]|uniref:META domain-containing protein n=1 Tax=Actinoplanes sp. ATCC 53533 TaxID=1288362 RepID=UPI00131570FD|nr:META domain-containing protein [Actinoplanes sp. ATCC 53533]